MNEILTEWQACLASYRRQTSSPSESSDIELSLLPNALQLYKLGLVLHNLSTRHIADFSNVQSTCHAVLQALPSTYVDHVIEDLIESFARVLQESDADVDMSALQSVAQLCEASSVSRRVISDCWTVEQLSSLIELEQNNRVGQNDPCILTILRAFLMNTSDFEVLLPCIVQLQQDATLWEKFAHQLESRHGHRWNVDIVRRFTDESQRTYLTTLLKSEENTTPDNLTPPSASKVPTTSRKVSPEQEIQRRIDQVRVVLPHLGEGFIEMALSCWKANVEETVIKLLEDDDSQWPVPLKVMDRYLPRRHNKGTTSASEEVEAKAIAKASIIAAANKEEYEARMVESVLSREERSNNNGGTARRDEYDDDYDDQYDDLDGVGNADGGLYDDYEAIMVYNRVAKQAEADKLFWKENQSSNRKPAQQKQALKDDKDDVDTPSTEKRFRGPDKLRGGRIPGRGRHGGDGRGNGARDGSVVDAPKEPADKKTIDSTRPNGRGNGARDGSVVDTPKEPADKKTIVATPSKTTSTKPNFRQKERNLTKRRDQQKKAAVDRSGA